MNRRTFISSLVAVATATAIPAFLKQTFAPPRSGPAEPSWSYRTTRDGNLVWKCLGPAQPEAMKGPDACVLDSNNNLQHVDYRALLDETFKAAGYPSEKRLIVPMTQEKRSRFAVNVYPRPAADLTKSPREMCVHDPAGVLLTCDICGPRPLSDGVFVE